MFVCILLWWKKVKVLFISQSRLQWFFFFDLWVCGCESIVCCLTAVHTVLARTQYHLYKTFDIFIYNRKIVWYYMSVRGSSSSIRYQNHRRQPHKIQKKKGLAHTKKSQSGIYYMGKGCDIYPSTYELRTHIQVDRQKCVDFSIESEKLDDFVGSICVCVCVVCVCGCE